MNERMNRQTDESINQSINQSVSQNTDRLQPHQTPNQFLLTRRHTVTKFRQRSEEELQFVTSRLVLDVYNCVARRMKN